MRGTLYCHSVASADDGRLIIHMTNQRDGEPQIEILVNAPFKAFDEDEVPRSWHSYRIKFERVDE